MEMEEKNAESVVNAENVENVAVDAESQVQGNEISESDDDADGEMSFEDLGLDEETLAAVERKGFKVPSPIQTLAIPRLLNGESNMIARARTGTGKTAAFGLPIIQRLRGQTGVTRALILEPTRELAIQTCNEMQSFTEGKPPRSCVLYGGASYTTQFRDLKKGSEIVVGTPGRIQDHLERGTLDISKIDYFILDEGDEMLDMGFVDDIEHIFEQANPNARILLFSATMPEPILKIAQKFMGDYEIVEEEGVVDEPLLIDQKYWVLKEGEKIDALVRLIDYADDFYGLVFTQTKSDADFVSRVLDEKGYEVAALHGDIAQNQREKILARFRIKKTRVLVATDVAARGIDISGLSHVVNYSLPFDGATYVHRIGRTGRAGAAGTAVTFVCPNETRKLSFLQRAIRRASKGEMNEDTIPTVDEIIEKKRERLYLELREKLGLNQVNVTETPSEDEKEGKAIESENVVSAENQAEVQNGVGSASEIQSADAGDAEAAEVSASGTEDAENEGVLNDSSEEMRAVTNMTENSAEKQLFEGESFETQRSATKLIKPGKQFVKMAEDLCRENDSLDVLASVLSVMYSKSLDRSRYGKVQSRSSGASANPDQTRLYVQLGKRDGYNAKSIADYFSDLLHIPGRDVDRIDMSQNFSLISLPKEAARRALDISRSDGSVPHIHIDTKDGGGGFDDDGGRGRRRGGGRGRGFGGDRGGRGRGFGDRERGRDRDRGSRRERERDFGRGRGSSRPNFHTPTERNSSSGFAKRRAERF